MSDTMHVSVDMHKDFLDTIGKWQAANDARYEAMQEAHNALDRGVNRDREIYNEHLRSHDRVEQYQTHLAHVVDQNAYNQRQQYWLIVGAIALAAFALGRSA